MLYRKNKIQKKFIRKSLFAKMLKNLSKSPRFTVFSMFKKGRPRRLRTGEENGHFEISYPVSIRTMLSMVDILVDIRS